MAAVIKDVLKKANPDELVSLVKSEGLFFVVMNNKDNRVNSVSSRAADFADFLCCF